jgi:hypothetical protein
MAAYAVGGNGVRVAGAREGPAERAGHRPLSGQGDAAGPDEAQALGPSGKRQLVDAMLGHLAGVDPACMQRIPDKHLDLPP